MLQSKLDSDPWATANPDKVRAHRAVKRAVTAGVLTRMPCERCGETINVQAHHDDYSRPLDVLWLCAAHHAERHVELRRVGGPKRGRLGPRTACKRGHEINDENVYVGPNGYKTCRLCRREGKQTLPPRTHCKYGHPLSEENTFVDSFGQRRCRPCHNAQTLAHYHKRKARAAESMSIAARHDDTEGTR